MYSKRKRKLSLRSIQRLCEFHAEADHISSRTPENQTASQTFNQPGLVAINYSVQGHWGETAGDLESVCHFIVAHRTLRITYNVSI